ncbi:MAG: hypothetical protein AMJ79_11195, partial [Phycisphaerae bacterium SM23_30]
MAQVQDSSANRYEGTMTAPQFPAGMEWLNTDKPLRLEDLKGKVVLLDFWTYCCINCMHVIPDLKKLEKDFPDELVVIGVHSAKFTTEKETENIRQAILRYEIEHPVVNDKNMKIWQLYGVRAWPTLVLIDPAGKIVAAQSGEGLYEPFKFVISKVIETFKAKGQLEAQPLKLYQEKKGQQEKLLLFPGKVLADEKSDRLFIADSNHNRIVVVGLTDKRVKEIIGSGKAGLKDGDFKTARFNHPQGMALAGDKLYVADTENHALRRVDFKNKQVITAAGMGEQARGFNIVGRGRGVSLNSPWDLERVGDILYIAMAGSHQI